MNRGRSAAGRGRQSSRTVIRLSKSRENTSHGHGGTALSLAPLLRGHSSGGAGTAPATRLAIGGRLVRGPRTSRTQHSCGLRRPRPAGPGGCAGEQAPAGPDSRPFPVPWPVKKRRARLREGRGQFGQAHGRGGSSGDPPRRATALGQSGAAGVPSKRPAAGAAAEDTRRGLAASDSQVSSLRLAPSAPERRRLAGRPVAQCHTKRFTSKTSLVCSMW
jgi:hypothetical protein